MGACVSTPGTSYVDTPIPARSTRFVHFQVNDADGVPITQAAQVSSIEFTLTDTHGTVINGREEVEVKNANGGELSESGAFSMELTPDDTREYGPLALQARLALFEVHFDAGRRENHLVHLTIENLPGVS
jgi:hypothetical protein